MSYDLIAVGGGLGASSLARSMAQAGARVLVLEREKRFRDRVRGEGTHPWGVAEAKALGVYELLAKHGNEARYWRAAIVPAPLQQRDLIETSPHKSGSLNFYHPEMQETLLTAAAAAGAEVRRGATVIGIEPGELPVVLVRKGGGVERVQARLVAAADGRNSKARGWAGFETRRDPERMVIAGVLMKRMAVETDGVCAVTSLGQGISIIFPLGDERFRVYYGYRKRGGRLKLSGRARIGDFVEASTRVGAASVWYRNAEVAGPLAEFECADTWVEHPYRDGVVLLGDAAAATDPCWGCGLSLTLRDVRVLRDHLLANSNWHSAARAYAEEHDRYYGALHRIEDWLTQLIYDYGPEADARRARALPRLLQDQSRLPDIIGIGPDAPSDEGARQRLFGED